MYGKIEAANADDRRRQVPEANQLYGSAIAKSILKSFLQVTASGRKGYHKP